MQTVVKALDAISGAATASGSVAEAIGNLEGLVVSDGAAAVTAALGPTGAITVAIAATIAAELEASGDITAAITAGVAAGIAAELEPDGAIAEAIEDAIPVAAAQANSEATTADGLAGDFNALLAKLRAAGIMAEE